jgi:hypothetical protein
MSDDNSYTRLSVSIRKEVFRELDKDPLLTAKNLAKVCHLPYRKYRQYLNNLRYLWKYNHKIEQGSKCSNIHCYKASVVFGDGQQPSRVDALELGWVLSHASNRFLFFRGKLGRAVWFETGTVVLHVRKPANLGRAKQLFCDGFFKTGLISDIKVFNGLVDRVGIKSLHAPYATSQRLPYLVIDDFVDSHGILIKVGDRSHPSSVEVIAEFRDRFERLEQLERSFSGFLADFNSLVHPSNGNGVVDDGGQKRLPEYLR